MDYVLILLEIILGFIVADLFTGAGHWLEDSYLGYCTKIPILLEIAEDNEMHHYFPRGVLAYSYLDHLQYSLPLTLISIAIICLLFRSVVNYPVFLITFIILSSAAPIFHRFAHMRECENNIIVQNLQKIGLLSSHFHHSLHHKFADEKYCPMSEYSNYFLDYINFWKTLETIIYVITGVEPNRKGKYGDYNAIHNHMHNNAKLECPDKPTIEDIQELKKKLKIYKNCKD